MIKVLDWAVYILFCVLGFALSPVFNRLIFHIGTDAGMSFCFLIGVAITTFLFFYFRFMKYRFCKRLYLIGLMGFFSFVPGYAVAYLFILLHV